MIEPSIAEGIAEGRLCPVSRTPFVPLATTSGSLSKAGREQKERTSTLSPFHAKTDPNQKTLSFAKKGPLASSLSSGAQTLSSTRRLSIPRSFKDLPPRQEPEQEDILPDSLVASIESSPYFASPVCNEKNATTAASMAPTESAATESIDPMTLVKENIPMNESAMQAAGHIAKPLPHGIVTRSKSLLLADYRYSGQIFKKFKS